jgi:hypothetical protein
MYIWSYFYEAQLTYQTKSYLNSPEKVKDDENTLN